MAKIAGIFATTKIFLRHFSLSFFLNCIFLFYKTCWLQSMTRGGLGNLFTSWSYPPKLLDNFTTNQLQKGTNKCKRKTEMINTFGAFIETMTSLSRNCWAKFSQVRGAKRTAFWKRLLSEKGSFLRRIVLWKVLCVCSEKGSLFHCIASWKVLLTKMDNFLNHIVFPNTWLPEWSYFLKRVADY